MAPGGGSISAYTAAMGVSLGTMVANLSAHKRGWDDRWKEFSDWAEKGMEYQRQLLAMVDEDTIAFNGIMEAFGLPKSNDNEKVARKQAIQSATKYATEVPLKVAQLACDSMKVMLAMAEIGKPNSITDAGVGALCARSAVLGAVMNVKVNARDLDDKVWAEQVYKRCDELTEKAESMERTIRERVEAVLSVV